MSERVRTAAVAAAAFAAILLFGGVTVFAVAVAGVAAVSAVEYRRIAGSDVSRGEATLVAAWAAVICLGFLSSSGAVPIALLALGALGYLGTLVAGRGPAAETLPRWGATLGAWAYVGLFLGCGVWVRRWGVGPVIFLVAVVWAGDTAAYYVGSALGSRPLAPQVSPKKSVEGAVASLGAAAVAAGVTALVLPLPHGPGVSVLLGLGLNVAAQLGDLAESLVKRCAGVKDSGALLPGHGGMLDRIDAVLPTLPLYAAGLAVWGGGG